MGELTAQQKTSSGSSITVLRNVENHSPNVTASYPRTLESSATSISELHISHDDNGDDNDGDDIIIRIIIIINIIIMGRDSSVGIATRY